MLFIISSKSIAVCSYKWFQFQFGTNSLRYPLMFHSRTTIIFINDLYYTFRYWLVHHFPDDKNLLNFNWTWKEWITKVKRMNKQVNQNLKNLANWLIVNSICLNVGKTEVVWFKSTGKQTHFSWKLKLNLKGLFPNNLVNYFGIKINEKLIWKQQMFDLVIKSNRQNVILSELIHFIDSKVPKSIYQARPFFYEKLSKSNESTA